MGPSPVPSTPGGKLPRNPGTVLEPMASALADLLRSQVTHSLTVTVSWTLTCAPRLFLLVSGTPSPRCCPPYYGGRRVSPLGLRQTLSQSPLPTTSSSFTPSGNWRVRRPDFRSWAGLRLTSPFCDSPPFPALLEGWSWLRESAWKRHCHRAGTPTVLPGGQL